MYSIEVIMTDNSVYNKVPYHWIIWNKEKDNEYVVAAGWSNTPSNAYKEAEDYFTQFILRKEPIPFIS